MKLSLSWIKDFVNIPEDMDMKQLAYDLTMDTVEVEDVEYLADRFDPVSYTHLITRSCRSNKCTACVVYARCCKNCNVCSHGLDV